MKALVVGNGGREHALVWKFARSNRISDLYVLPGNGGTSSIASNIDIDPTDVMAVRDAAVERKVDVVFVGPEVPLSLGLVDTLGQAGIRAIGPHREAAQLESSKAFSKQFMKDNGIPTAAFESFTDATACTNYISEASSRLVVKKSGLAAGKGVIESDDKDTLRAFAEQVIAEGDEVVVEQRLSGFEVSVFALCDGSNYALLPACTDYKKAGVGSTGPNTGGMGAICPVPWLEAGIEEQIRSRIIDPTFKGLAKNDLMYCGVLYFGVMVTDSGPYLLEYNVRFGDPEAQVLLPLIQNDFTDICVAMINGKLDQLALAVTGDSSLGVVIAAPGYPSSYPKGLPVDPLPNPSQEDALVFHAATSVEDDTLVTGGGRCFTVVGLGQELLQARTRAYQTARDVTFPGSWMRQDIGGRIFGT